MTLNDVSENETQPNKQRTAKPNVGTDNPEVIQNDQPKKLTPPKNNAFCKQIQNNASVF